MKDIESQVKSIVRNSLQKMISDITKENIQSLKVKHEDKVHFIPRRYRVISGLLQSLNIRFGNGLQEILGGIIEISDEAELELSPGAKLEVAIASEAEALIDKYIADRSAKRGAGDLNSEFSKLLEEVFEIQKKANEPGAHTRKRNMDIDLLFALKPKDEGGRSTMVYVELKYNDDHDTGKFREINSRVIKTWAGLVYFYGDRLESKNDLIPVLYYFNSSQRYPPTFIPSEYIMRGPDLFERYLLNGEYYNALKLAFEEASRNSDYWKDLDNLIEKVLAEKTFSQPLFPNEPNRSSAT